MQPVIAFTEAEEALHVEQARLRSAGKRGHGVRNLKVDATRTDLQTDLIGVRAEHAASILFGVPYGTCAHLGGDGGVADLVFGGRSIQVKSTHYPHGKLAAPHRADGRLDIKADLAVLFVPVRADAAPLRCAGYLPRGEFYARCTTGYLQKGGVLTDWVEQADLRPVNELLDLVELNRQGARLYRLLRDLGGLEKVS